MAFKPKLGICLTNNCNDLILTDTTGLYDASLNPEGWNGGGHPNNSTITSASVDVYLPHATIPTNHIVTTAVTGATINNYQSIFELGTYGTPDVNLTGKFPDGIYKFQYKVVDSGTTYKSDKYQVYLYCNTQCCVDKMLANIAEDMSNVQFVQDALLANAYLLSASQSAFSCGNFTAVDKLVEQARKICQFYNKTCC